MNAVLSLCSQVAVPGLLNLYMMPPLCSCLALIALAPFYSWPTHPIILATASLALVMSSLTFSMSRGLELTWGFLSMSTWLSLTCDHARVLGCAAGKLLLSVAMAA